MRRHLCANILQGTQFSSDISVQAIWENLVLAKCKSLLRTPRTP